MINFEFDPAYSSLPTLSDIDLALKLFSVSNYQFLSLITFVPVSVSSTCHKLVTDWPDPRQFLTELGTSPLKLNQENKYVQECL